MVSGSISTVFSKAVACLCRAIVILSRSLSLSLSPFLSFWSSVSRAIVFFSSFLSCSLRRRQVPRRPHQGLASSQSVSRAIVILSRSLSLSPLFSPSGRLSAELLSSFLLFSPVLSDDDKDHDDLTKDWRLLSPCAELLCSFWSSVSRAIVFFPRLLSFSSSTTTRTTTTPRTRRDSPALRFF